MVIGTFLRVPIGLAWICLLFRQIDFTCSDRAIIQARLLATKFHRMDYLKQKQGIVKVKGTSLKVP